MVPNILLVEDDHLDILNAQRVLSKINLVHNLIVAKNGEEALNLLWGIGTLPIDPIPEIILLDLNMPKMSGFEFLSVLRLNEKYDNIKIFVLTTSSEHLDRELCFKYDVCGYIEKPFRLNNAASKQAFDLYMELINLKNSAL